MNDLEAIANKFNECRIGCLRYRYPKALWDEIQQITEHYPIAVIAKAIHISPQYIRKKIGANPPQLTLSPIKVASFPSEVSIFTDHNFKNMTIRFQANHEQLIHLIRTLSGCKS